MKVTKAYTKAIWIFTKSVFGVVTAVYVAVVGGFAALQRSLPLIDDYCTAGNPFLGVHLQNFSACPVYISIGWIAIISIGILIIFLVIAILIDLSKGTFNLIRIVLRSALSKYKKNKVLPPKISCEVVSKDISSGELDVFIKVKNLEWFIDLLGVSVNCNFSINSERIRDSIKWNGLQYGRGRMLIKRRQEELLHLATVIEDKKAWVIHSIDRNLFLPIFDNNIIPFEFDGITSSDKPYKHKIIHHLVIIQIKENGKIRFEAKSEW